MKRSVKIALGVFGALILFAAGCLFFLLSAGKKTPKTVEVHGKGDSSVLDGVVVETEFMVNHRIYYNVDEYDVVLGKRMQRVVFSGGEVTATEVFDREDGALEPYTWYHPNHAYCENTGTEYVFGTDMETEYRYPAGTLMNGFLGRSVFEIPKEKVIVLFGTMEEDVVAFLYFVETATMKKAVLWEDVGKPDNWGCSIDGDQLTFRIDREEQSRLSVFHINQPERMLYAYEVDAWDVIGRYDASNAVSEQGTVCYDADVYVEGDRVYIAEFNRYFEENSISYRVYVGERGETLYQGEVYLEDKGVSQEAKMNPEYELEAEHGGIRIVPKQ